MDLKAMLKGNYMVERWYFFFKHQLPSMLLGDRKRIETKFHNRMGFIPNIDNPQFFSEKIQWVKLYDRKPFNTLAADKYRVREYYREKFGEEHIVPLLCKFDSWKDVTLDALPDEPFIIKANTGTGTWQIVRNTNELDIKKLRYNCRKWTHFNYYYQSQEWQYKNIKPCIIVEKLLTDDEGHIPVDYKLHYINGELQFIYCVADREGNAYRAMYSPDWKLLPFQFVSIRNHTPIRQNLDEPRPVNLDLMIQYANEIAKNFKYYVRVDFYEVSGKLYFGEITMHHGSGMNLFYPPEAERKYAEKLIIDD